MVQGQNVFVVDGIPETEQVLRAVLEPRGIRVRRIGSGQLESAASQQHSLLVLEEKHADIAGVQQASRVIFSAEPRPTVLAGSVTYLRTPFEYGDLIEAIESLADPSSDS